MTQGFYEQLGVAPDATTAEIRAAYARLVAQLARRRAALEEQGGDPSPLDLARSQAEEAWTVLSDPARRRRYDAMRSASPADLRAEPAEIWRRVSGALVHPGAGAAAELLRVATTLKVGALPPPPVPDIPRGAPRGETTAGRHTQTTQPNRKGRTDPGFRTDAGRPAPTLVPPPPATDAGVPSTPFGRDSDADVVERKPRMDRLSQGATSRRPEADEVTVTARAPAPPAIAIPKPRVSTVAPTSPPTDSGARAPSPRPVARAVPMDTDPGLSAVSLPNGAGAPVVRLPAAQAPKGRTLSAEDIARLTDRHGYSGALLKAVREAKAIQLQAVADGTRISLKYLEAIEGDQHDRLPSPTFVRGYVKQMARFLGLDEEAVSAGYSRALRA